ncbi:hypothetical protein [Demequina aestuarii]|uniref:hypothetical protein n=1 Tax=Demequina aestuarii TaxID=327095 RepID=UPI00078581C8|nr:hypothetical protein [Demequina aestuarii]
MTQQDDESFRDAAMLDRDAIAALAEFAWRLGPEAWSVFQRGVYRAVLDIDNPADLIYRLDRVHNLDPGFAELVDENDAIGRGVWTLEQMLERAAYGGGDSAQ